MGRLPFKSFLLRFPFPLLIFALLFSAVSCDLPGFGTFDSQASTVTPPPPEPEEPAEAVIQPQEAIIERPDANVLNISMRPPHTLNPLTNNDVTVDAVLKLIYEPLAVLDEQLKPVGNLADYYFSSDYRSVNISIRNDAIWSDGIPVGAEDAVYSIETLRNAPDDAIYKHCVQNIESYEIIDTKTLKVFFKDVKGDSPYALAFPLIPSHAENIEDKPLGNGLFSFEAIFPNEKITLLQSPYSFKRQALIERVNVLFVRDRQTEIHAFNQNLIDVISMSVPEWTRQRSVKRIRIEDCPAMYFDFIGFNFNHPLMRQLRFREGVSQAFNIDCTAADIYLDHALRAETPVNPASWFAINPKTVSYDTEEAKQKISAALRNAPSVTDVRILANEESDERVKIAKALSSALRDCGLVTVLDIEPFDVFTEKIEAADYEILVGSYNLSVVPDLRFALGSSGNILNYSNPLMDDLLAAAQNAFSEAEYAIALAAVQNFIAEELPLIGLAFRNSAVLTGDRVRGDLLPSADNIFANINNWELGN